MTYRHLTLTELFEPRMGSVSGGASAFGPGGEISLYHTEQTEEVERDLKPDPSYVANYFYRDDIVVRALMGDATLRAAILKAYDIRKDKINND